MDTLHLRDMPDELCERLRRHARRSNRAVSAVVIDAIERELAKASWREHWEALPTTDLGTEAASLLTEERAARDTQIG